MKSRCEIIALEDNTELSEKYRILFNEEPDLHLYKHFRTGEEYLNSLSHLPEHVLLLDLILPGMSGMEVLRRLSAKNTNFTVLVTTMSADPDHLFHCLKYGATGYLTKPFYFKELLARIRGVLKGEVPISASVASYIKSYFRDIKPAEQALKGLTQREMEILHMVATGKSNADIAKATATSISNVEKHVKKILDKLHVANRSEAAFIYGKYQK